MGGANVRYLEFNVNDGVSGQGPEVHGTLCSYYIFIFIIIFVYLATFEALRIQAEDINKFWTAFNALNFDGTGLVTMER